MYLRATIITRVDEETLAHFEDVLGTRRRFEPDETEKALATLRTHVIENVLGGELLPGEAVEVELVEEPAEIAA